MPKPKAPTDDLDKFFGLSFSVPTETVELPSGGKYYPPSSKLHQLTHVEIKHMTAKEEDILAQPVPSNSKDFSLFDKLIKSLLVDKEIDPKDMLEDDKTAILLSARKTGYGSKYESNSLCDLCQKIGTFEFDLDKTSFSPPETELEYDPESNTFSIELPVSKINIRAKVLGEEDNKNIDFEEAQKAKVSLEFNRTLAVLRRIIYSANDIFDPQTIAKLVEVLPAADAKYLLNFHNKCYPKLNTTQEVACPNCGGVSEKEVPFSWAFFRIEF